MKVGITCEEYKTDFFRKGLLKEGFVLEYDGNSGVKDIHLFRIDVDVKDIKTINKISDTLKALQFNFRNKN